MNQVEQGMADENRIKFEHYRCFRRLQRNSRAVAQALLKKRRWSRVPDRSHRWLRFIAGHLVEEQHFLHKVAAVPARPADFPEQFP